MFIYSKTKSLHKLPSNDASDFPKSVKLGKGLSAWESDAEEGQFITELAVGGEKPDSYKTNMKQKHKLGNVMCDEDGVAMHKTVIKQHGITMDAANSNIITFESMRDMVLNNTSVKSEEMYTSGWDSKSKDVVTCF